MGKQTKIVTLASLLLIGSASLLLVRSSIAATASIAVKSPLQNSSDHHAAGGSFTAFSNKTAKQTLVLEKDTISADERLLATLTLENTGTETILYDGNTCLPLAMVEGDSQADLIPCLAAVLEQSIEPGANVVTEFLIAAGGELVDQKTTSLDTVDQLPIIYLTLAKGENTIYSPARAGVTSNPITLTFSTDPEPPITDPEPISELSLELSSNSDTFEPGDTLALMLDITNESEAIFKHTFSSGCTDGDLFINGVNQSLQKICTQALVDIAIDPGKTISYEYSYQVPATFTQSEISFQVKWIDDYSSEQLVLKAEKTTVKPGSNTDIQGIITRIDRESQAALILDDNGDVVEESGAIIADGGWAITVNDQRIQTSSGFVMAEFAFSYNISELSPGDTVTVKAYTDANDFTSLNCSDCLIKKQ